MASGPVRVKHLGKDRFYNRYWWLDGAIGAYEPPEIGFFDAKGRPRVSKHVGPLDWASGYLFVEDFSLEDKISSWEDPDLDEIKTGNSLGRWGYYCEPIQVSFDKGIHV
jgi:hypothetical protein